MQFFIQYLQQYFSQADEQLQAAATRVLAKHRIIIDPEQLFNDIELDGMTQAEVKQIIDDLDKLEQQHLAESIFVHLQSYAQFKH